MTKIDYTPPKYVIIKHAIMDRLERGEYEENEAIPSENQLMKEFDVSRITVRRALEELVRDGVLYRLQGKGTFVSGAVKQQNLFSLTSCTEDVIRLGMKPTRKVLFAEVVQADKRRREVLDLTPIDRIFTMARVYYADGNPINQTTVYVPYRYFPGIERYDFSQESLYGIMEREYGVEITRAQREIEAVTADDKLCDYLEVHAGVPLLLFRCVTYGKVNGEEHPIETFRCYYRSDMFKFYINQVNDRNAK